MEAPDPPADLPVIRWLEDGQSREATWRSLSDAPPPTRIVTADARMSADDAYGLACQGTALLWRGDYHDARQMLAALGKRADRRRRFSRRSRSSADTPAAAFHEYRQFMSQRARTLNALLVPLVDHAVPLRRAPDVRAACAEAFGIAADSSIVPLRALLGVIGAHEWRVQGIDVPEAGGRIHPHFGVFAPVRREYVDLVANTPLPVATGRAFDVGTGTGVLAAVLARRGLGHVIATDVDARALACARDNVERLGLASRIDVIPAHLFPPGRAALVVCNPPWVPARPSSSLEAAVYDPDSRMLRGFLDGLAEHLEPDGEGWLVLSDLAEHLGLRPRAQLLEWFAAASLRVLGRHDVAPRHPRSGDAADALHAARAAEVTSLWRLGAA